MQDSDLDDFFAAARAAAPVPQAALIALIEADALAEQAHRGAPRQRQRRSLRRGLSSLLANLGGGGIFAGLVSATMAGIWLGIVQPAPVSALAERFGVVFSAEAEEEPVDLIPGFDSFVTEG
jgi:hypothetical protein